MMTIIIILIGLMMIVLPTKSVFLSTIEKITTVCFIIVGFGLVIAPVTIHVIGMVNKLP